jgi:hypothetical protein
MCCFYYLLLLFHKIHPSALVAFLRGYVEWLATHGNDDALVDDSKQSSAKPRREQRHVVVMLKLRTLIDEIKTERADMVLACDSLLKEMMMII